jgi:hypothetical protein
MTHTPTPSKNMIFHSQLSLGSELPDLIITRQNNLVKLVYDSSTHLYRNSVYTNFANDYGNYSGYHVKTLTLNNWFFVAIYNTQSCNKQANIIIKFTNTLQEITKKELKSGFSSFATDSTNLFISTEGKLVSLNQDFQRLIQTTIDSEIYLHLNNGKRLIKKLI